jgi:hypothetical protein
MDDPRQIAAAMKDALLRKLGDEIDLIFEYGSYLRGATHKYSDFDISYVPVHEATHESITVLVGDKLFDLYPIRWSTLEQMAEFRNVSATVLLSSRIVYQRTEAAAGRFETLAARLRLLQQPEARPNMLRRAMELYQGVGYDYYLLKTQAEAGRQWDCLRCAQSILRSVLHCLAVANQTCIDTRKLEQVLALPNLPPGFAETVQRVSTAFEPAELLAAVETLLRTARELLLAEQQRTLTSGATFAEAFHAGYPELKRDLQGIMLACERQDMFTLKASLLSLYHEMSYAAGRVITGGGVFGLQ